MQDTHISENELDIINSEVYYDEIIYNDGTLVDYYEKIKKVAKKLKIKIFDFEYVFGVFLLSLTFIMFIYSCFFVDDDISLWCFSCIV